MRRWVLKIASGVSLLLCLVTVVLWMRSEYVGEIALFGMTPQRALGFSSQSGMLGICVARSDSFVFYPGPHYTRLGRLGATGGWAWLFMFKTVDVGAATDCWGYDQVLFANTTRPAAPLVRCWFLTPRYWQLAIVFSVFPTVWLVKVVRSRSNRALGFCASCDYNLTGNASGVCPECGRAIA